MNVYDVIDIFAVAIRDTAAITTFCTTNYTKGLLVQVDDDAETPIGSAQAPYCLLQAVAGSEDSNIAESTVMTIRMEVGLVASEAAPLFTDTTARTASANGLRKYGQGEKAVDLMSLCLAAVKAVSIDAFTILKTSTIDAEGTLFFPLQLAVSTLTVGENKDLSQ